jgi:hypothetical protein
LSTNPNYTSFLSQGGGVGDDFAIIEVYSNSPQPLTSLLVLPVTSILVQDITLPIEVRYTLYGNASDAVNDRAELYSLSSNIIEFVNGLGDSFADAFTHQIGFGTEFLRFVPTFKAPSTFSLGASDGDLASLAKFRNQFLIVENVRRPSDSSLISDFRDLVPEIDTSEKSVIIFGDFSSRRVMLNSDNDCSGSTIELLSLGASNQVHVSLDDLFVHPVLCIDLTGNTEPFPRSEFRVDLGLGGQPIFFGKVAYSGSSVHFPFLTVFSEFKQKILITNFAGYDIPYRFEFFIEDDFGGRIIPNDIATGTIPALSVVKIDTPDLVMLENSTLTRFSARMLVGSLPEDISVAVQLIKLSGDAVPNTNVLDVLAN